MNSVQSIIVGCALSLVLSTTWADPSSIRYGPAEPLQVGAVEPMACSGTLWTFVKG